MSPFWPALQPPSSAAPALVCRLAASVAVAKGLASGGRVIDVSGLDDLAGLLCAQVLDLPRDDGLALRPALTALERDIGTLIGVLQAAQT